VGLNDIDSEPSPPLVFKWIEEYHLLSDFMSGCSCPGEEFDLDIPHACQCLEDLDEKKFAYDIGGLIHHPPGIAIIAD